MNKLNAKIICIALFICSSLTCPCSAKGREADFFGYRDKEQINWTIGVQAGTQGTSGITAQLLGINGNALNIGLGLSFNNLALYSDYLFFYTPDFKRQQVNPAKINELRGKFNLYAGFGAQLGYGILFRLPFGFQYMMREHPVDFFGNVGLVVGSYTAHKEFPYYGLLLNIGIRVWI